MRIIFYYKNIDKTKQKLIDQLSIFENFDCESEYVSLIQKLETETIDIMIFDYSEYITYEQQFAVLRRKIVNIPIILIAGELEPNEITRGLNSDNYQYTRYADIIKTLPALNKRVSIIQLEPTQPEGYAAASVSSISETLIKIGIKASSLGFTYLIDAIRYILNNDCKPVSITKELCTFIAEKHDVTKLSVSRCMSTSIQSAWQNYRIKPPTSSTISFDEFSYCPTPKEFIYHVARKIANI